MPSDEEAAYHPECYRKFTALPPQYQQNNSTAIETANIDAASTSRRSTVAENATNSKTPENATSANTDVQDIKTVDASEYMIIEDNELPSLDVFHDDSDEEIDDSAIERSNITCVYCKKKQKKHRGRHDILQTPVKAATLDNLETTARELHQFEFENKIKRLRKVNKIAYHQSCKHIYDYTLTRGNKSAVDSEWHESRDKYRKAFQEVCRFVLENIVQKQESYYLSSLHSLYMNYSSGNGLENNSYFLPFHLEQKLSIAFSKQINFIKIDRKKIVKHTEGVVLRSDRMKIDERDILSRAALVINNHAVNKKPKLSDYLQPLDVLERSAVFLNLDSLKHIHFSWILSHFLEIENTPMWVGFNSLIYSDNTLRQRIAYLTTINLSFTNTTVVLETLKQCLQVSSECGANYAQVSYDLAIAKVAFQLQFTYKPRFDTVFIHVGIFHVQMNFYKAMGKFIDDCGITNVLVDAGLLADGSLNAFIAGKHFNRCKRIHSLLYLALRNLHFERFVEDEKIEIDENMKQYLIHFRKTSKETPTVDDEQL